MDGKKILIVDDANDILTMLELVLGRRGYLVRSCANGQEALGVMNHGLTPDLILLDLMMPVMNGWEFLEALSQQQAFQSVPVVVMSAFKQEERLSSQVREFLRKPLDFQKLQEVVTDVLAAPSSTDRWIDSTDAGRAT